MILDKIPWESHAKLIIIDDLSITSKSTGIFYIFDSLFRVFLKSHKCTFDPRILSMILDSRLLLLFMVISMPLPVAPTVRFASAVVIWPICYSDTCLNFRPAGVQTRLCVNW